LGPKKNHLLFSHFRFLAFELLSTQAFATQTFWIEPTAILATSLLGDPSTTQIAMVNGSAQGLSLLPPRLQTAGDLKKVWTWLG
jgi:hypothetical protein